MTLEANKEVIRAWVQARNTNDLDAALRLWADQWQDRVRAGFSATTAAFPDVHITIDDIFAEGSTVVLRATMRGTHSKTYMGIPATQRSITYPTLDIYTLEDGKIQSIYRRADDLGLLKQLGATVSWEGQELP